MPHRTAKCLQAACPRWAVGFSFALSSFLLFSALHGTHRPLQTFVWESGIWDASLNQTGTKSPSTDTYTTFPTYTHQTPTPTASFSNSTRFSFAAQPPPQDFQCLANDNRTRMNDWRDRGHWAFMEHVAHYAIDTVRFCVPTESPTDPFRTSFEHAGPGYQTFQYDLQTAKDTYTGLPTRCLPGNMSVNLVFPPEEVGGHGGPAVVLNTLISQMRRIGYPFAFNDPEWWKYDVVHVVIGGFNSNELAAQIMTAAALGLRPFNTTTRIIIGPTVDIIALRKSVENWAADGEVVLHKDGYPIHKSHPRATNAAVLGTNLHMQPINFMASSDYLRCHRNITNIQQQVKCISTWGQDHWGLFSNYLVLPTAVDASRDFELIPTAQKSHRARNIYTLYVKTRSDGDVSAVERALGGLGLEYVKMVYGSYSQAEYYRELRRSRGMILLAHGETQGLAIDHAMALDVPLLVVATGNGTLPTDVGRALPHPQQPTDIPYVCTQCGMGGSVETIARDLADFVLKIEKGGFEPRNFIGQRLGLAQNGHDYIETLCTLDNDWMREARQAGFFFPQTVLANE